MNNTPSPAYLANTAISQGYDLRNTPVIFFETVQSATTRLPASFENIRTAAREGTAISMRYYRSINDLLQEKKLSGTIDYNYLLAGIDEFSATTPIEVYADGSYRLPSK